MSQTAHSFFCILTVRVIMFMVMFIACCDNCTTRGLRY